MVMMGPYSALLGSDHDRDRVVPPDPTQRVLSWGGAYPCLRFTGTGVHGQQCGGLMIPGKRCFKDEGGRLWRRFVCNRKSCGRVATDWKEE